jgi:dTDP-4-amino-4,6-dideoxygalactose transaminase
MGKLALFGGEKAIKQDVVKPWPFITEEDKKAVMEVLDYGLSSADTPQVEALQKEWADYVVSIV